MDDRVLTFVYQYGLGGLVFFASLIALRRAGLLGSDARQRRRWTMLLVGGVILYAAVQGLLQFVGPSYDLCMVSLESLKIQGAGS